MKASLSDKGCSRVQEAGASEEVMEIYITQARTAAAGMGGVPEKKFQKK